MLISICFLFSAAYCVFFLYLGQLSHASCVLNHMEHVFVWTLMIEDICLSPYICLQGIFASFNDTANSMFLSWIGHTQLYWGFHCFYYWKKTWKSLYFIFLYPFFFLAFPLLSILFFLLSFNIYCQPCGRQDLYYPKLQVSDTITIVYNF